MKHAFTKSIIVSALTAASISAVAAEGDVDLDDITMNIVTDGRFDANQLGRPDREAITQNRANAEGSPPDAEDRAEFWQQRAGNVPEGVEPPSEEVRAQFEALHEAMASGDPDAAAAIREQIEAQMGELGLERPEAAAGLEGRRPAGARGFGGNRPEGAPDLAGERPEGAPSFDGERPDLGGERPEDAPTRDEIREIIESGDEDAIADLRELWAERKNRGRPQE